MNVLAKGAIVLVLSCGRWVWSTFWRGGNSVGCVRFSESARILVLALVFCLVPSAQFARADGSADQMLDEAESLLAQGRYADAAAIFESVLAAPDVSLEQMGRARLGNADCKAFSGDYDAAVAEAEAATHNRAYRMACGQQVASIEAAIRDKLAAEADSQKAIWLQFKLGLIHEPQFGTFIPKKGLEAVAEFRKVVENYPEVPDKSLIACSYAKLGGLYTKLDMFGQALSSLETVVRDYSDYPHWLFWANVQLAELYPELGRFEAARQAARYVIEAYENGEEDCVTAAAWAQYFMGESWRYEGKYELAIGEYEKTLSRYGTVELPAAHAEFRIGQLLAERGGTTGAVRRFEHLLESYHSAEVADIRDWASLELGNALVLLGRPEDAIRVWRDSMEDLGRLGHYEKLSSDRIATELRLLKGTDAGMQWYLYLSDPTSYADPTAGLGSSN